MCGGGGGGQVIPGLFIACFLEPFSFCVCTTRLKLRQTANGSALAARVKTFQSGFETLVVVDGTADVYKLDGLREGQIRVLRVDVSDEDGRSPGTAILAVDEDLFAADARLPQVPHRRVNLLVTGTNK